MNEWLWGIVAYYNVRQWESRFILVLNAAKNNNYIEKCFKQKLHRIKFSTKKFGDSYFYISQESSQRAPKICRFWNIIIHRNGKAGSLKHWILQKILIIYIEKCFEQKLSIIKLSLSLSRLKLRGSKNFPFFIYFNALTWERNFYIIPDTLASNSVVRWLWSKSVHPLKTRNMYFILVNKN